MTNANQLSDGNGRFAEGFLRLPESGTKESFSGLSRSALNSLILPTAQNGYKPPVRSGVMLLPGNKGKRGVRVICKKSLRTHIEAAIEASMAKMEG